MNDKRSMLRHFLAVIAYRTQKALRDAPASFGTFDAGSQVRTPTELVRHMTSVLGHARMFFVGGRYHAEPLADLSAEIVRFMKCWWTWRTTSKRGRNCVGRPKSDYCKARFPMR